MKFEALPVWFGLGSHAMATWNPAHGQEIRYTSVEGYFLQDDPMTNATDFDYAQNNFGLIDRRYPTDYKVEPGCTLSQWERFNIMVRHLNKLGIQELATYKVLFMGRHGEGYHNVAESTYGTPAWNCYWAELEGNGNITWADALLTPNGIQEAEKANAYYHSRYEQENMPHFESYYSSPLRRCIQTANYTFGTLDMPEEHPFIPTIKELFREEISIHTCDRRSSKSDIAKLVPNWKFEDGFTEHDELWEGDKGETDEHQLARSKTVLDDVFTNDESTWISISSHSGEISSLLQALGHRPFSLSTGQIIPVLVKAELVKPEPATTTAPGFTAEATCKQPPLTSIHGKGCVCTGSVESPSPTGQ